MKEKRYIHVYTGDGKGKTTAAFGLAIRAACAGLNVYIGQFVKGMEYSEVGIQKVISNIKIEQYGRDCFIDKKPEKEDLVRAKEALKRAHYYLKEKHFDMLILDEHHIAIYLGLLELGEVLELIDLAGKTELISTGRYAPRELLERADLVTEMKEIKHYYDKGQEARKGIEY